MDKCKPNQQTMDFIGLFCYPKAEAYSATPREREDAAG
jgi:hypothetical protein